MPRAKDKMPNTRHELPYIHYESGDCQFQAGVERLRCHQLRQTNPIVRVFGLRMRVEQENKANRSQFRPPKSRARTHDLQGAAHVCEKCETKPIGPGSSTDWAIRNRQIRSTKSEIRDKCEIRRMQMTKTLPRTERGVWNPFGYAQDRFGVWALRACFRFRSVRLRSGHAFGFRACPTGNGAKRTQFRRFWAEIGGQAEKQSQFSPDRRRVAASKVGANHDSPLQWESRRIGDRFSHTAMNHRQAALDAATPAEISLAMQPRSPSENL